MATNQVLRVDGTQFLFADVTDFPNSGAGPPTTGANSLIIGTPTKVQMDLTGVAAAGGANAWSSEKLDLGAIRAEFFSVSACLEFETSPADGGITEFYWVASPSGTDGTGNPGGLDGTDSVFTDTGGILGQFQPIGVLPLRLNVINIGFVGIFSPIYQYGMLAFVNQGSTALRSTATAMDETHIVITPIIPDIQAAA